MTEVTATAGDGHTVEVTTTGNTATNTTTTGTSGNVSFNQDQVSAIAAREAKKAREKAQADFVSSLGFSNADEIKSALEAFKEHQEKSKTAEQRLAELEQERKSLSGKAEKYAGTVNALLEAQLEQIPEDKRGLVPEFDDPADRLSYITKNRNFLIDTKPVNANVGTGTSPGTTPPQSPVSYQDFKKLTPQERISFYKEFPEQAKAYSARLRTGE